MEDGRWNDRDELKRNVGCGELIKVNETQWSRKLEMRCVKWGILYNPEMINRNLK